MLYLMCDLDKLTTGPLLQTILGAESPLTTRNLPSSGSHIHVRPERRLEQLKAPVPHADLPLAFPCNEAHC